MIYKANFNVNNGTRLINPLKSRNKFALNFAIRESALEERFQGNNARWRVVDEDDRDVFVAEYYAGVGTRYSVYNYKSVY